MSKTATIAVAFAVALLTGAWSHPAAAMGPAAPAVLAATGGSNAPVKLAHYVRHRRHQRHYWRWDHRPVWDDPWEVLRPTIWGSPEPHYAPADIWARKWHLGHWHRWAHHHHR